MVKIKFFFVVVSLLTLFQFTLAQEKKPEELYKDALPSVMTLIVKNKDGSIVKGTAFLAINQGLAVTAWHVIENAQQVIAKFSNGEEFDVSGVVDKDERRDVAIIKVKVFGKPVLPIALKDTAIGSRLYIIGAPQGLDFSLSDGILSQVRTIEGVKNYQFSCPASQGNSGGPLLTEKGEVLGVVSWQFKDGQNLSFAIPSIYALGLDSSLTTQAWDTLKPKSVSAETKKSIPRKPDEILAAATTLCINVTHGSPVLKTQISGKLVKWGKLTLITSPEDADLVMYVVQTGSLNTITGEGNQATVLLKERVSDVELWSVTKGGSWALSGWKVSSVANSIADSFIKYYETAVGELSKSKTKK